MDIKKYRRLIGLRDLPYEDLSAVCRDLFEELGKMLSIRLLLGGGGCSAIICGDFTSGRRASSAQQN
jgi:hypothetical protein